MLLRFFLLFVATLLVAGFSPHLLQAVTEDQEVWREYEQLLAKWEEARVQHPNLPQPVPPPQALADAQGGTVLLLSVGIASILWGLWRTVLDAKHHRIGAWLISLFVVGAAVLGMLIGGADIASILLNAVVLLFVVIGGLHIGSTFAGRASFLHSGGDQREQ